MWMEDSGRTKQGLRFLGKIFNARMANGLNIVYLIGSIFVVLRMSWEQS